ncbi:LamG-like jellyroll fold domain-containing protein [Luteolibacter marinus]|uniref:LamG-like jellyroll fold domain-containing protein n=1 Tax=Luteolibacter marinus TaxID=2776705 RepID=UPI001866DE6A|nr:LamG-like jellyroll fold domain-containing protein [Luteolibacter marinus]
MKRLFLSLAPALATVPLHADVIRVDPAVASAGDGSTWVTAMDDLQAAISAAASGDEIWVAQGTYKAGAARTDSFNLNPGVKIYGGFPTGGGDGSFTARNADPLSNATVISGDIDDDGTLAGNSYNLINALAADAASRFDGFTLIGGNADNPGEPSDRGGAITLGDRSPVLANLLIRENRAVYGGGLHANGSTSFQMIACRFEGNTASNSGGAIYLTNAASPSLTHVTFTGNESPIGGAIRSFSSNPTFISCAFAHNHSASNGGALYNDAGGSTTLRNTIIWGNTPGPYNAVTFGGGSVANLIQGQTPNGSTIHSNSDPRFRSQPFSNDGDWTTPGDNHYGDLSLLPDSPAIDYGDNAANSLPTDLAGNPRVINGDLYGSPTIDIGPFESPSPTALPTGEIHRWTFDGDTRDSVGDLELALGGEAEIRNGALVLNGNDAYASTPAGAPVYLGERTLVAWVSPSVLDQSGGGVLTLVRTVSGSDTFDGIVYAERTSGQWMNGSNSLTRSVLNNGGAAETVTPPGQVMIAIVYGPGNTITLYRNGSLYSTAGATQGSLVGYPVGTGRFHLGQRHPNTTSTNRFFAGLIDEARVYNTALDAGAIAALHATGPTEDLVVPPSGETNLARGSTVRQSRVIPVDNPDRTDPGIVIDGSTASGNRNAAAPTTENPSPWVEVELPEDALVERVEIANLTNTLSNTCCFARLRDITIELRDASGTVLDSSPLLNPENAGYNFPNGPRTLEHAFHSATPARIVRVIRTPDPDLSGSGGRGVPIDDEAGFLEFAELRVFGEKIAPVPVATSFSATYDSRRADPNPVAQLWYDTETAIANDYSPFDGFLDSGSNVGIVTDGYETVWQIRDQLTSTTLDNPWNRNLLDPDELLQLYDLGWTFTATVRALSDHASPNYAGYAGWGFTAGQNPGWDIGANAAARVGFGIGRTAADNSFYVIPANQPQLNLPAGTGDDYHTITAVCPPRSTVYEWFIDGISQGTLDFSTANIGGLTENVLAFGSGRQVPSDGITNWKHVSLVTAPPAARPSTEGLVFYLPFEPGPEGNDTLVEKSQAPGSKPAIIPSGPGLFPSELIGGIGHSINVPNSTPARHLDASAALPPLLGLDSVTLSAWVKPHSNATALFHFYKSDQASIESQFRVTSFSSIPNLWLRTRSGGTDFGENMAVPVPDITDGRWHHVAAVISPTRAVIYYDGRTAISAPGGNPTAFTSALSGLDTFEIGSWMHVVGNRSHYRGGLDEVAIWNRDLSDEEIAALHRLGYLGAPLSEDQDKDGINSLEEASLATSDGSPDSDGDGLTDAEEIVLGTNPASRDSDGDGIPDNEEIANGTNPLLADSDGDGFSDSDETLAPRLVARSFDRAPDGSITLIFQAYGTVTNLRLESSGELNAFSTLPGVTIVHTGGGLHTATATPPAGQRFFRAVSDEGAATDPLDPTSFLDTTSPDSDGDGLSDAAEATLGTDPGLIDTDTDTFSDFVEILLGTNQLDPDSHPGITDTDGDGLTEAQESALGTDPNLADSDDDTYSDHAEVNSGSDPNSAASVPGSAILTTQSFSLLENGNITLTFRVQGAAQNLRLQSSGDLTSFPDLDATLNDLGGGRYAFTATPPSGHRFFRAAGDDAGGGTVSTLTADLDLPLDTEGSPVTIFDAPEGDTFTRTVLFSSPFTGYLSYTVRGIMPNGKLLPAVSAGLALTGATSAEIPLTFFNDLLAGAATRYTVTLTGNPGLVPGLNASFTVAVTDDDAIWSGTFGTATEQLGFVFESLTDGTTTRQHLTATEASGLFPRGTFPVSAAFGPTTFSASAANIPLLRELPGITASPSTLAALQLASDDALPGQEVTPATITGVATLMLAPPKGTPAEVIGTFHLQLQPPPPPSTDLHLAPSP